MAPAPSATFSVGILAPFTDSTFPVAVKYQLTDSASQPMDIAVWWSVDSGATFQAATETTGVGSDGLTQLASSPIGTPHLFVWDAALDLPGAAIAAAIAIVRVAITSPYTGSADSPQFHVLTPVGPAAPAVKLGSLPSQAQSPVFVKYTVSDPAAVSAQADIRYSIDGGLSFSPATDLGSQGSEGRGALAASPAGTDHLFVWNAAADLSSAVATPVALQVTVSSPGGSASTVSPPMVVASTIAPRAPTITGFNLAASYGPAVAVRFVVSQPDSQPVDVRIQYQAGTGSFTDCKSAAGSDSTSNLPAPAPGAAYRFLWDAAGQGITQEQSVVLQVTPICGGVQGTAFTTAPFSLDTTNNYPPAQYQDPAAPPPAPVLALLSGNNQTVISGQLSPQSLFVQVTDQGAGVFGAHVSFAVDPAGVAGTIETDVDQWSTTDANGYAAVRFRAGPTAGTARVIARIAGVKAVTASQTFTLTVAAPRILAVNPPTKPLSYGTPCTLQFAYDGDGDPATADFAPDPLHPVRLQVVVSNAIASCRTMLIPGYFQFYTSTNSGSVTIVPNVLDNPSDPNDPNGKVTVTVTDLANPTVVAVFQYVLQTPPNVLHRISLDPANAYQALRVNAVINSGLINGQPQVGYAGLTLKTPFNIRVAGDGATPVPYNEMETDPSAATPCAPGKKGPLRVIYNAYGGGTLWTDTGPRTDGAADPSTLAASVNSNVYFTPSGGGPWTVQATLMDAPLDPNAVQFTDANGNCTYSEVSLNTVGSTHWAVFSFPVQQAEKISLVDAKSSDALASVQFGSDVKLRIVDLSPCIAGGAVAAPDQLTLTSYLFAGASPTSYTYASGGPAKYEQQIAMSLVNPQQLDSAEMLLVPGQPLSLTLAAGVAAQSICAGGVLRWHNGCVDISFPVDGGPYTRRLSAGVEAVQESPVASTPASGAGDTISLASGEFVFRATDLEIPCRRKPLLWGRAYRSGLMHKGPLGPGWTLFHGDYLTFGPNNRMRWNNGIGRFEDFCYFDNAAVPFGQFVEVDWHVTDTIDDTTSPIVAIDSQRNETHFNEDGSLRFWVDRFGNKIKYTYNEKGQLTTVTDVHRRTLTLNYWKEGDTIDPRLYGLLNKVTEDYSGRFVEYEYYEVEDDPNGPLGFLKTVYLPAAPAMVNGQINPGYRRAQTYVYETTSLDPTQSKLLEVHDSENNAWCVNRYDGESRVYEQDHGTDPATGNAKTFKFAYDPSAGTATMTDQEGRVSVFQFTDSPYADAGTPVQITEKSASGDRVWRCKHDRNGFLVYDLPPAGPEMFYVYAGSAAGTTMNSPATGRRGSENLLAVRTKAGSGLERIWSLDYSNSGDFNLIGRVVPPEGNLTGVNSENFATTYWYGANGELIEVLPPRRHVLNLLPDPKAGLVEQFLEDTPMWQFAYNALFQVKRSMDPTGVVTEYHYYEDAKPTGGPNGVSADGGGFVGEIARDVAGAVDGTAANPRRDTYFPAASYPVETLTTRLTYDVYGSLQQVEDPWGGVTSFADDVNGPSALGELTQISQSSPADTTTPLARTRLARNSSGRLVELSAVAAAAGANDAPLRSESWTVDPLGNPGACATSCADGSGMNEEWIHNLNGELVAYRAPGQTAGIYPQAGAAVQLDDRGGPQALHEGMALASGQQPQFGTPLLLTGIGYGDQAQLSSTTFPGGEIFTRFVDEFGALQGGVDPLSNVSRVVSTAEGEPSRGVDILNESTPNAVGAPLPAFNQGTVGAFRETCLDEGGMAVRGHRGLLMPGANGASIPKAADFFQDPGTLEPPSRDVPWPPAQGTNLLDGPWGKGDGRITADRSHDVGGRLVRAVDDELGITRTAYDAHGRVSVEVNPAGDIDRYVYNTAERSVELQRTAHSSDPQNPGSSTYFHKVYYDGLMRLTKAVDGGGNAIRYEYDELGELYGLLDQVGPDSTDPPYNGSTVNQEGNLTSYRRKNLGPLNRIEVVLTASGMGSSGGPDLVSNPYNNTGLAGSTYEHQVHGALSAIVDERGNRMEIGFDDYGRPQSLTCRSKTTGVADKVTSIDYDPSGRVQHVTDPRGTTLHLVYDTLGRITDVHIDTPATGLEGATGFTFQYKPDRSVVATDKLTRRAVTRYSDSAGRLVREVQGPYTVGIDPDGAGRARRITYSAKGSYVTYKRFPDGSGRLDQVFDGTKNIAQFAYMGADLITRLVQPGISTTFGFDPKTARLTSATSDSAPQIAFAVAARDRAGRIKNRTRTSGVWLETFKWVYDSAGRVIFEEFDPSAGFGYGQETTQRYYDADGALREEVRRRTLASGAVEVRTRTQEREERGRIISQRLVVENPAGTPLSDVTTNVGYDNNCNVSDDGTNQYFWDAWNRLIRVEHSGTVIAWFEYDPYHRLIKRTAGPRIEEYVYDGDLMIEVYQNGAAAERYVYSDNGDMLAGTIITTGFTYYPIYSPEGNIDTVVGEQHDVRECYRYSLRGEVEVVNPLRVLVDQAAPAGTARPLSRFLFKGRMYDPDTGLCYWGARWYHPALNQFLTPDPLGAIDGNNHYALARNDAINLTDVTGRLTDDQIRAEHNREKTRDMDHFLGSVAGSVTAAGMMAFGAGRLFLWDWYALWFNKAAAARWKGQQESIAEFGCAVLEHRTLAYLWDDMMARADAANRAELEGRYYDAGFIWGDYWMNVYLIARPVVVPAARLGLMIRRSGLMPAFRAIVKALREYSRCKGVWRRQAPRGPGAARGLRGPRNAGDVLFQSKNWKLARALYKRRAVLNSALNEGKGVETGLYRRRVPNEPYEYAVVQGGPSSVDPPDTSWQHYAHFHPGAPESPGLRLPSPPDVRGLVNRAEGSNVYENIIHSLARDGSVQAVHYGFDPATSRVWIEDLDGPRLEFPHVENTEKLTPGITPHPFEYYDGWWNIQMK